MPMNPRTTRPLLMSSSAIWRIVLLETANPRPSAPAERAVLKDAVPILEKLSQS